MPCQFRHESSSSPMYWQRIQVRCKSTTNIEDKESSRVTGDEALRTVCLTTFGSFSLANLSIFLQIYIPILCIACTVLQCERENSIARFHSILAFGIVGLEGAVYLIKGYRSWEGIYFHSSGIFLTTARVMIRRQRTGSQAHDERLGAEIYACKVSQYSDYGKFGLPDDVPQDIDIAMIKSKHNL